MPPAAPIRSCSRWGLPCRPCCQGRGALLPHRFTLARGPGTNPGCAGGLFSVALSLGSPPPAVGRHRIPVEPGLSSARRASPANSGRPAVWHGETCAPGWTCVKRRPWPLPAFAIRGMLAIGPADPCGRAGGRIAQLVEQLTLNQRAVGSSPTAPTNEINTLCGARSQFPDACGVCGPHADPRGMHWAIAQHRIRHALTVHDPSGLAILPVPRPMRASCTTGPERDPETPHPPSFRTLTLGLPPGLLTAKTEFPR